MTTIPRDNRLDSTWGRRCGTIDEVGGRKRPTQPVAMARWASAQYPSQRLDRRQQPVASTRCFQPRETPASLGRFSRAFALPWLDLPGVNGAAADGAGAASG